MLYPPSNNALQFLISFIKNEVLVDMCDDADTYSVKQNLTLVHHTLKSV